LAREIVGTMLANLLVNRLGILAVPRLMGDFEASTRNAVRALAVGISVSQMGGLWDQLDVLPGLSHKATVAVSQRLKLVSMVLAAWVLRHGQPVEVGTWIGILQAPMQEILSLLPKVLKGRPEVVKWAEEWVAMGLPTAMANRMVLLSPLVVAPDVALLSSEMRKPVLDTLVTHLRVGEALRLPALVKKVRGMHVTDAWTRQAVQSMGQEIFSRQTAMSKKLLVNGQNVEVWLENGSGSFERYNMLVRDMLRERELSVAMLSVLLGRLRELEG
jgi:NAD-specific glutamate dehydrogenase